MQSKTRGHYPQIVFRNGIKQLWNPILKKAFQIRPEERVRLQLVDYLTEEAGFPVSRLSFESPVNLPKDRSASRTDLICYDKGFSPLLLVECKAPDIKLDEKAALQISRYNQEVEAPFLLITNGVEDHWFEVQKGKPVLLNELPPVFDSAFEPEYHFIYWSTRGFAGNKSQPDHRDWIMESCSWLYSEQAPRSYLRFEDADPELCLPNYYRIYDGSDDSKVAVALTATPFGATKLSLVLNQDSRNTGLLSASLDLLAGGEAQNTLLQSQHGFRQLDLRTEAAFSLEEPLKKMLPQLNKLLLEHS